MLSGCLGCGRDTNKVHVWGAPSFHVGESGIPVVARFGVLASATVMVFGEVAAVGLAVIRAVVAALGSGLAWASCGATSWQLRWGLCLCGEGLCNGLLDDCAAMLVGER